LRTVFPEQDELLTNILSLFTTETQKHRENQN